MECLFACLYINTIFEVFLYVEIWLQNKALTKVINSVNHGN